MYKAFLLKFLLFKNIPDVGSERAAGIERQRNTSPCAFGSFSNGTISNNNKGINRLEEFGKIPKVMEYISIE
jgi:hypothetical protein